MGIAWAEDLLDAHGFSDALLLSRQPPPDEDEQERLARFQEAWPEAVITHDSVGLWKGHVPLGDSEVFIVRYDGDCARGGGLLQLLKDLEEALRGEAPG